MTIRFTSRQYYQCWNAQCAGYAGSGDLLDEKDTFFDQDTRRCKLCKGAVRKEVLNDVKVVDATNLVVCLIVGIWIFSPEHPILGGLLGLIVAIIL